MDDSDLSSPTVDVRWRTRIGDFPIGDHPAHRGQPYTLELPNAMLREAAGGSELGDFLAIGEAWAQLAAFFMPNDCSRVLDIGCGCGKMARFFVMNPKVLYLGLDAFAPAVAWCQHAFAEFPRFEFKHLDVFSTVYNSTGHMRPDSVTLPVAHDAFGFVICGSLFTHLLEPALVRYLSEIARVLMPGGRALISIHNTPSKGRISGDETRIDIDSEYFIEKAAKVNLELHRDVGTVYGQQVYVLARR